jgi:hypothetical protein
MNKINQSPPKNVASSLTNTKAAPQARFQTMQTKTLTNDDA